MEGTYHYWIIIWPKLYYHLSRIRQVYVGNILVWQQNDNYKKPLSKRHFP